MKMMCWISVLLFSDDIQQYHRHQLFVHNVSAVIHFWSLNIIIIEVDDEILKNDVYAMIWFWNNV